jgi:molecular chaperone DnaJ
MPAVHQDYYTILGVPRDADDQTIKRAFRKLAFEYHPDRNKESGAEDRFKEISEAYAVLSDPEKRAAFDAGEAQGARVSAAEDIFSNIDFRDLFSGLGFDFAGAGRFDHFMRQRRRGRVSRGANLEARLAISLQRVAMGGEEILHLRRPTPCPTCHGSGAQPGTQPERCPDCQGRGERIQQWRQGGLIMQQIVTCSRCQGQGRFYVTPCATCRGRKIIERDEQIAIHIPVGVEDGMVLRVPGQGMPSPDPGGMPGDLFVVMHITPDERFERRGTDLWQHVMLSVEDGVLGTQVEIPTLQAPFRLDIPAGTQPEAVLRLRHYGLPEFGGQQRGDMYVRVQIHIPERLSREEREQYEHLRAIKQGHVKPSATPRSTPRAGEHHALSQPGLRSWLAICWNRIDATVRRWLQGA